MGYFSLLRESLVGIESVIWIGTAFFVTSVINFVSFMIPLANLRLGVTSLPTLAIVLLSLAVTTWAVGMVCVIGCAVLCYVKDPTWTDGSRRKYRGFYSVFSGLAVLHAVNWFIVVAVMSRSTNSPRFITSTFLGDGAYAAWLVMATVSHWLATVVLKSWGPSGSATDTVPRSNRDEEHMRELAQRKSGFFLGITLCGCGIFELVQMVPMFVADGWWSTVQMAVMVPTLILFAVVATQLLVGSAGRLTKIDGWRIGETDEFGNQDTNERNGDRLKHVWIPGLLCGLMHTLWVAFRFVALMGCLLALSDRMCAYPMVLIDGVTYMLAFGAMVCVWLTVVAERGYRRYVVTSDVYAAKSRSEKAQ